MSKYIVAAAACYVTVPGVGAVLLYRGAPVPDSALDLARLETDGSIAKLAEDEVGGHPSDLPPDFVAPDVTGTFDDGADDSLPPPKAASKDEWVDYVVTQGVDRDEAEASTKDDLINIYGRR